MKNNIKICTSNALKRWIGLSSFKDKGVWTWGHVIYDYHSFFRNMALLGLNRIVIWNDILPLNAGDVLEEAHRYGIKLVWGFSWGWQDNCKAKIKRIDKSFLRDLQEKILDEFSKYEPYCADGIYFQSFTETDDEKIGGIDIAEAVTDLVNSTAAAIFEKHPHMEIEFGLHATSVRTNLDILKKVDRRIRIVWEDCGAFPFDYDSHNVNGFDETADFVKKLLVLRGEEEKCGFVLKGMTKLDWANFKYHDEAYNIGGASEEFIRARAKEKESVWEYVADGWRKNSDYAKRMIELISRANDPVVYELIEDGMFEYYIKEPVKMFSEMVSE